MASDERLKRLAEKVLAGKAKDGWLWAHVRGYFPAESDEESQRKLAEWGRENHIDTRIEQDWRRESKKMRVVVFEPKRRRPIRSR